MIALIVQTSSKVVGSSYLGVLIPATVFFISFFLAYCLYRHFSNKKDDAD
jgi:hypothetical protein